jgi:iron complex outermembrane recepter protein
LLSHRFNAQWDASAAYYQVSGTTQLGDGNPVDSIKRCDLRVARKFNSGRWNGEVSGVVENLFNSNIMKSLQITTRLKGVHVLM